MRPDLARLQQIEQHLRGSHTPSQAPDWQLQCLLDPELDADTQAQRQLYRGLYVAGQQQLRRELNHIHGQLYGPRAGIWAATTARLRRLASRWLGFGRA